MSKRVFDIVVAATALALVWPLFLIIAVLIKADSAGPVFFRQWRVGLNGRKFRLWKFRKMRSDLPHQGRMLTSRFDLRLTKMGRFLERTKLDELPQLFNVLSGDMSIIGPRPEVPKFVEYHAEQWQIVLSVKPGIFGLNQFKGARNESELYPADCLDLEGYYVSHILPKKLHIDREYVQRQSGRWGILVDVGLLLACAWVTLSGIITWRTLRTRRWQIWNLLTDTALVAVAVATAWFIRFENVPTWQAADGFKELFVLALLVRPVMFLLFGTNKGFVRSFTLRDVLQIVRSIVAGSVIIAPVYAWYLYPEAPRGVLLLEPAILLALLMTGRYIGHRIYIIFVRRVGYQGQHRFAAGLETLSNAIVAVGSLWIAGRLLFGPQWPTGQPGEKLLLLGAGLVAARLLVGFLCPVGTTATTLRPIRKLLRAGAVSVRGSLAGVCAAILLNVRTFETEFNEFHLILLDTAIFALLIAAVSLAIDTVWRREKGARTQPLRLLIVGISDELIGFLTAISTYIGEHYDVVGVVETQSSGLGYRSHRVANCEILGTFSELEDIFRFHNVGVVICLKDEMSDEQFKRVCRLATEYDARVRVLDNIHNFIMGQPTRVVEAAHEGIVTRPAPRYLPERYIAGR